MKILTIGDVHGRDLWKKLGDINELLLGDFIPEYDKYVFLGDYCDSFTIANDKILQNLKDIINFKKRYPNNVELLWGNHEMHYLYHGTRYQCTGFRGTMWFDLNEIFRENYNLFKLAYQCDNYLFTHAGIHKGWYKFKFEQYDTFDTISESLNYHFDHKLDVLFDIGYIRGGLNKVGGPLWLDKNLGYKKPLNGYHQIVGHTHINEIKTYIINNDTTITFCDNQKDKVYDKNLNKFQYILTC